MEKTYSTERFRRLTFQVALHVTDGVVGTTTRVDVHSWEPNLLQFGKFDILGSVGGVFYELLIDIP